MAGQYMPQETLPEERDTAPQGLHCNTRLCFSRCRVQLIAIASIATFTWEWLGNNLVPRAFSLKVGKALGTRLAEELYYDEGIIGRTPPPRGASI